jgi:hypothetical protein
VSDVLHQPTFPGEVWTGSHSALSNRYFILHDKLSHWRHQTQHKVNLFLTSWSFSECSSAISATLASQNGSQTLSAASGNLACCDRK